VKSQVEESSIYTATLEYSVYALCTSSLQKVALPCLTT